MSSLSFVPASGVGRLRVDAHLKFFYGPMDCGKSTLALQMDHNHARQGRQGLVMTTMDRSGKPSITTRIGLGRDAVEVTEDTDLVELVRAYWATGRRVDYLICDEVQFYSFAQIEQLADLVDHYGIDVYAFGLATDFRSELFPGTKRLLELADEVLGLQVEVLCWCGRQGRFNARIVDDELVKDGDRVMIGDTQGAQVRYQVMCRRHYRVGQWRASAAPSESLPIMRDAVICTSAV